MVVVAMALTTLGLARLLTVRTIGAPFGPSVRIDDMLATLVRTQEPYVPSLHRNPDRDRFRIDLMLTPLLDSRKPRMIALARDLQQNAFHPGTRILGIDGPLLWMMVPELKALDLRSSRLITLKELRAANPALEEMWISARFHFDGRLHLMSADRQRSYAINPDTMRAVSEDAAPRITWQSRQDSAETQLCLGGPVGSTDWLAMLSAPEREGSFRVGSTVAAELPFQKSRAPRSLHRFQVERLGTRFRIVSIEALGEKSYANGALIRDAATGNPLAIDQPPGALIVSTTGTVLEPGVTISRVASDGRELWSTETGLREFGQFLPGADHLVVIGRLPAPEGTLPEPAAVVIEMGTGEATRRSLQP